MLIKASPESDAVTETEASCWVEALRHGSALVSLFDAAGRVLLRNPAAAQAFGDAPTPAGREGNGFVTAFVDPRAGAEAWAGLTASEAYEGEAEFLTKDGRRWHAIQVRRTTDPATGAPAVLLSAADVTARRRAETELARAEERYRAIFENAAVGIVQTTPDGRVIDANPTFARIFGYPSARTLTEAIDHVGRRMYLDPRRRDELLRRLEAEGTVRDFAVRGRRRDGAAIWLRATVHGVRDAEGRLARCIATVEDVTERVASEAALRRAEEKYRGLFENSPIGIYQSSADGRMLGANPALVRFNGYATAEALTEAFNAPDSIARLWYVDPGRRKEFARRMAEHGEVANFVSRVRRRDGALRWIAENARAIRGEDGGLLYYEGTVEDITERRRLESGERLRVLAAVRSAGDAIVIVDDAGRPAYLNPAFEKLLGFGLTELTAAAGPASLFLDRATADGVLAALAGNGAWRGEAELRSRQGRVVPVAVRVDAIRDAEDEVIGSVFILSDISQRRRSEARIRHLAHHDALTGLPNRVLLRERLERTLAASREDGGSFALHLLDLDHFKEVNDTLGHDAGDRVLRAVAARLRRCVRRRDTVARFGSDEFAVLQGGLSGAPDADRLARRLTEALARPITVDGHEVPGGVSIGVVCVEATNAGGVGDLLRNADVALYRAKAEGRGGHCFFDEAMNARHRARKSLERDLRNALAADAFEVHFQPLVRLADGRPLGAEALLRWRHPERGPVPPSEFIPLAEEAGLIAPLGAWALKRACRLAAPWGGLKLAVNLSPVQFRQADLVANIAGILDETGFDPARLELEITEGVLFHDTEAALVSLTELKTLGVRVAMDDFGTGYSSLSYLHRFPFDKIKIDRGFVADLGRRVEAEAIVRAAIGIGRNLGMSACAEGVETEEQAAFLRAEGCEEAQGYHFGKPAPAAEIADLLRAGLRRPM